MDSWLFFLPFVKVIPVSQLHRKHNTLHLDQVINQTIVVDERAHINGQQGGLKTVLGQ